MKPAREQLAEIQQLESKIKTKKLRLAAMREIVGSVKASEVTGMPRNPSPERSQLANSVNKIVDLEREIARDEIRLKELKEYLLGLIGTIESQEYQTVLILRYFNRYSWEQIAKEICCSDRQVYYLHRRSLDALECAISNDSYSKNSCS